MQSFQAGSLAQSFIKKAFAVSMGLAMCVGCSLGGDDDLDGSVDLALVGQLQAALAGNGVTPIDAPPAVSAELFALGQALFFDKIISGNQDVSCATCHLPSISSADGRTLPRGVDGTNLGPARFGGEIVPRNSPALFTLHGAESMFWDARIELLGNGTLVTPAGADLTPAMRAVFLPGIEILAAQAMFPPTSRAEMRGQPTENELADLADADFTGIWSGLMDRLLLVPAYSQLFQSAYPMTGVMDFNFAHAANAIAAFESEGFGRADSAFQRFVAGDTDALTNDQLRGGIEFFGNQADCSRCHSGSTFTDNTFHNTGQPQFGPGKGDGVGSDDDFGREQVTGSIADRYRFRTPTLLNIELTAPYGHVGQYSDLTSMVQHYRNATGELMGYNILEHVTDPDLINTQLANDADVLLTLDGDLQNPQVFNVQQIVTFLRTLTADSALDMSDLVPVTVPSGLPIDS
ncbi:MAG: cytochrome c peroxidase [Glaciecola sp.]|jgi:cytochrome c peroxidase